MTVGFGVGFFGWVIKMTARVLKGDPKIINQVEIEAFFEVLGEHLMN